MSCTTYCQNWTEWFLTSKMKNLNHFPKMNSPSCCFKQYMAVIRICKIIIKRFFVHTIQFSGVQKTLLFIDFWKKENTRFVLNFYFLVTYRSNLFGSKIRTRTIFSLMLQCPYSLSVHLCVPDQSTTATLTLAFIQLDCPFLSILPPVISIQPEDIFKSILACAFSHRTLLGSRDGDNIVWWNFTST